VEKGKALFGLGKGGKRAKGGRPGRWRGGLAYSSWKQIAAVITKGVSRERKNRDQMGEKGGEVS